MAEDVSVLIDELDEFSVLFARSGASSWFKYSPSDSITSTSLSSLLSKPASQWGKHTELSTRGRAPYASPFPRQFLLLRFCPCRLRRGTIVYQTFCSSAVMEVENLSDDDSACGADSAPSLQFSGFRCRSKEFSPVIGHILGLSFKTTTSAVRRRQYDTICDEATPQSVSYWSDPPQTPKAYVNISSSLSPASAEALYTQLILNRVGSYSLFGQTN